MADSEICGTKDPTFHRILLDTRFELPLGECGVGRQRTLTRPRGMARAGWVQTAFPSEDEVSCPWKTECPNCSESEGQAPATCRAPHSPPQVTKGQLMLLDP